MKQYKTGFTLIEVVVALLIGSLLTVSLYQILSNIQKSVLRIMSVVDLNTPVIGFYNQLQRDTLGIFTPRTIASEKKSADAESKAQPKVPAQQGQSGKTDKTGKTEQKKIENIFVCTGEGLNFSCNFITTGGIKLISSTGSYIPAPYNKRVIYALEPDKSRPGLYILTYGQTDDLDVSSVKTIARYELMRNIKKFEANFKIFEPVSKKEGKEKPKPKLITSSRFVSKDMFKKYQSHIPAFIEIKGSYIDPRLELEFFFKYLFEVPAYSLPEAKKEQVGAEVIPGSPVPGQAAVPGSTPGQPAGVSAAGPAVPSVGPAAMNNLPNQKNSLAGFVP